MPFKKQTQPYDLQVYNIPSSTHLIKTNEVNNDIILLFINYIAKNKHNDPIKNKIPNINVKILLDIQSISQYLSGL